VDSEIYLSVVVPVYDEADNVEPLHREIDAALAGVERGVEFIYVDDGSRDGSPERLLQLAKRDQRVRVIRFDANHGQSGGG
jgi:glycosyltransferase involved in cell wall biosynthesis